MLESYAAAEALGQPIDAQSLILEEGGGFTVRTVLPSGAPAALALRPGFPRTASQDILGTTVVTRGTWALSRKGDALVLMSDRTTLQLPCTVTGSRLTLEANPVFALKGESTYRR